MQCKTACELNPARRERRSRPMTDQPIYTPPPDDQAQLDALSVYLPFAQ